MELLRLPFRYQAGICLLILLFIITATAYADPCQDEKPEQLNDNCPTISDEGPNDIVSAEHRQATSDTGFPEERTTKTFNPGYMDCNSENGGFSHPCMSHQESREDRQQGANGGELPMNQDGQPPFHNGDNGKDPSFPGHSMGSCPMTGGFTPCSGMSDKTSGQSGPVETVLNSGDIALKSMFITSGFGFPMGLDAISQSIIGILQGSAPPGDSVVDSKTVPPVFRSNETDGTGRVSGLPAMMGPGRGYDNQNAPGSSDTNYPPLMMGPGRGYDNQNAPGSGDTNYPPLMMGSGRGCDNQNAPGSGENNYPTDDRSDMSTSCNGEFTGPYQKQISTAGCDYNPMGCSSPLENRESP